MNYLELRRQIMHICLGTLLITLYYFDIIAVWGFGLLLLVLVAIIVLGDQGEPITKNIMKQHDRKQPFITGWGAFTFFQGFLVATILFEKTIALAALAIMVYGDGFSALIGTYFGKHTLKKNTEKTWEGTMAGFLTAFAGALIFVSWPLALIGALVGMTVEILAKPNSIFDDNFLIPIITGTVMLVTTLVTVAFI